MKKDGYKEIVGKTSKAHLDYTYGELTNLYEVALLTLPKNLIEEWKVRLYADTTPQWFVDFDEYLILSIVEEIIILPIYLEDEDDSEGIDTYLRPDIVDIIELYKEELQKWSVKFLEETPMLIESLETDTHYLIAPLKLPPLAERMKRDIDICARKNDLTD